MKICKTLVCLWIILLCFGWNLTAETNNKDQQAAQDMQNSLMKSLLGDTLGMDLNGYTWLFALDNPTSANLSFSDKYLTLVFEQNKPLTRIQGPLDIIFYLTNNTKQPMQILWDKCTVDNLSGKHRKVLSAKQLNNNSITDIKPGQKYADNIVPEDGLLTVHHDRHFDYDKGEWIEAWNQITGWILFADNEISNTDYMSVKQEIVGKTFNLKMVFLINGKESPYLFTFRITDIKKDIAP